MCTHVRRKGAGEGRKISEGNRQRKGRDQQNACDMRRRKDCLEGNEDRQEGPWRVGAWKGGGGGERQSRTVCVQDRSKINPRLLNANKTF